MKSTVQRAFGTFENWVTAKLATHYLPINFAQRHFQSCKGKITEIEIGTKKRKKKEKRRMIYFTKLYFFHLNKLIN